MDKANYWIEKLEMINHPEGGYFREVYRSEEMLKQADLPDRFTGDRCVATSIYFLLKGDEYSSFHRIRSDETWHFYDGSPIELTILNDNGNLTRHLLGRDFDLGQSLQITVPQGNWFGARVTDKNSFALAGCTVAPGFYFDDFELADRAELIADFPQHASVITSLTY
jgi:uncharacterized protein